MNGTINCIYQVGARSVLSREWWEATNISSTGSKFYYVEKGAIVVQIYGQTITAGPGDLMLIPPRVVHSCWMTEDNYAEKCWCHFSMRNSAGEFFERFELEPVLHVPDREVVGKLFDQLFASHDMPAPQRDLAATTALCGLVQYYLDHTKVSPREYSTDRVIKVIDYINRHYTENLSLEQLAEVAGYSTTHLSKRFREVTGRPPVQYLNLIRIDRAKYLLQYTVDPIGSIMEQCGFTSAAYFARVFKKMLGYSPQAFRELNRTEIVRK
ncbi:MAG: helix-turn-helix domain-containing protein [Ruminococcaceae bacterium]|nr:helix-turn-helix domain-containing protein [Oscillospiraceae bacterium]